MRTEKTENFMKLRIDTVLMTKKKDENDRIHFLIKVDDCETLNLLTSLD